MLTESRCTAKMLEHLRTVIRGRGSLKCGQSIGLVNGGARLVYCGIGARLGAAARVPRRSPSHPLWGLVGCGWWPRRPSVTALPGLTLDAPIRPPGDCRGSKIHCLADDRG